LDFGKVQCQAAHVANNQIEVQELVCVAQLDNRAFWSRLNGQDRRRRGLAKLCVLAPDEECQQARNYTGHEEKIAVSRVNDTTHLVRLLVTADAVTLRASLGRRSVLP
jgi:hypothetical protein